MTLSVPFCKKPFLVLVNRVIRFIFEYVDPLASTVFEISIGSPKISVYLYIQVGMYIYSYLPRLPFYKIVDHSTLM